MKIVKRMLDNAKGSFSSGGRLEKLAPLFEATETFFFLPGIATRRDSHVRDHLDVKRYMSIVILALLPVSLFGLYNTGRIAVAVRGGEAGLAAVLGAGASVMLPMILVSYAVGFFWETLFASIRKHPISEGLLVTGLLFPLTLPPTIPLWQVAVGISFGVVIGKEVFGGTGRNILNPALTGRAFLFFAYPARMSGDTVWRPVADAAGGAAVDAVSGATPLAVAAAAEKGSSVASLLEEAGYSLSLLAGGGFPGSVGETSALLCLAGAIVLIATGIASYRIILGGVAGVLAFGAFLNLFASAAAAPYLGLNPVWHLVMGGFAFGITFMATDPVSAPGMPGARWVYGFLIGALTVMIRVFNPAYPEGVMLAILFMNLFAPLLDQIAIRSRLRKRIPNV